MFTLRVYISAILARESHSSMKDCFFTHLIVEYLALLGGVDGFREGGGRDGSIQFVVNSIIGLTPRVQ